MSFGLDCELDYEWMQGQSSSHAYSFHAKQGPLHLFLLRDKTKSIIVLIHICDFPRVVRF